MPKQTIRFVVLTGPPGCGKTTLIKNICDNLRVKNFSLNGFFTEEVRCDRNRIGFDVVLLDGKRAPLARLQSDNCKGPTVGKYVIDVKSFELCVLPVFDSENKNSILVIDEIGKMELLSKKFQGMVQNCIDNKRDIVLATVPLQTARTIPLVEMVKRHPETCLITVTRENRNELVDKITNLILSMKEEKANAQV